MLPQKKSTSDSSRENFWHLRERGFPEESSGMVLLESADAKRSGQACLPPLKITVANVPDPRVWGRRWQAGGGTTIYPLSVFNPCSLLLSLKLGVGKANWEWNNAF